MNNETNENKHKSWADIQEEEEKRQIEEQMRALADRLEVINGSLAKKYITRNEYDKTIQETQSAFNKILESS